MAKKFTLNFAFKSKSQGFITRDKEHLIPKLSDAELSHAKRQGYITERDVPESVRSGGPGEIAEATGATKRGGK